MQSVIQYFLAENIYVWGLLSAKIPPLGGGHQCKVQTSLHSGPMLKIGYPVSHNLLVTPLLPSLSPFSPYIPTHVTKFY
jgi:hypothetical protein